MHFVFYSVKLSQILLLENVHEKSCKRRKRRILICPHCGSAWIADILYGEPAFDDELEELLEKGEIYLGGCCIFSDSPKHHCNDCKKDFTNTAYELWNFPAIPNNNK